MFQAFVEIIKLHTLNILRQSTESTEQTQKIPAVDRCSTSPHETLLFS